VNQITSCTREERLKQALFRGAALTLENPKYRDSALSLLDVLVRMDLASRDLTAEALALDSRRASVGIVAGEQGIAAGLAELALFYQVHGLQVELAKKDGDKIHPGDVLLRAEGAETELLSLERVGLNLTQRMCGIATAIHRLQERVTAISPATYVVGTRKTPWGLLDKRALHLGNGGTHRLDLGDAILIKNNHLALQSAREEDAARLAVEKAWKFRGEAAFIEVEVRALAGAREAARTFCRLLEVSAEEYPCLLMLDNMKPDAIAGILEMLRRENLWDFVLIEASGGISETNVDSYAACGVDAISVGALTHSVRALDLHQRIS
jgi:nicotinate-nucleotide pyrophosphorylase (carboxylating)